MFYVITKTRVHFWDSWADETRRERVDAYDRNRRTLRTGDSFRRNKSEDMINMRKTENKSSGNARFSSKLFFLDINNLTEMSTTRGEHLSFTAMQNDQKWRTWRGDGHHQTWHTATQDVQNCETSRMGCLETWTLRGKGETNNAQMRDYQANDERGEKGNLSPR